MSEEKKIEVKDLIKEGKSQLECVEALLAADETLEAADALASYKSAKKAVDAAELIEAESAKKAADDAVSAQAKKVAEAALKEIKVDGIIQKAIASGQVQVTESPDAWKADQAKMFRLMVKANQPGASSAHSEIAELKTKFSNVWNHKVAGIVTDENSSGGFFVRPEFDLTVDKIVYERSELLDAMQIRRGGDKIDINSISPFDFTNRADQNAAFAETKPTFSQERLEYRETGAIVPIAKYALEESEYDLVGELMSLAADAKIRHIEPAVTTGKVSDGDFFDGMRFKTGVTTSTIADAGTGGTLTSKDLSNAYLACASQTRKNGAFVLDTRELCLLLEERDNQNMPIETIMNVNGQFIHKKTGRPIIVSDLMSRTNNALTSNTGGVEVGAFFADLSRFRIYQNGAMDIAQSDQIFFKEAQIGFRFILRYKFGIPAQSLSSFVTLQGVENSPIV